MSFISYLITNLTLAEPLASGRLSMVPVLSQTALTPDYLTLDQALAGDTARVGEVGEAGHVPELLFRNDGATPVLLLDGEELIGAKQNRILNLSILAPAYSETKIPVSCVEANRWDYRSRHFGSSDRAFYASGRAAKMASVSESLVTLRSPRSDQTAIWDDIAATSDRLGVRSETAAMTDIFEGHRASVDAHLERFAAQSGQIGAIFAIDGRIIGMDLFDCAATWARLAPKLVRSYALDAVDGGTADDRRETDSSDAREFLRCLGGAEVSCFPAIGLGEDWRAQGATIGAAALVRDGVAVHLCAFVQHHRSIPLGLGQE